MYDNPIRGGSSKQAPAGSSKLKVQKKFKARILKPKRSSRIQCRNGPQWEKLWPRESPEPSEAWMMDLGISLEL